MALVLMFARKVENISYLVVVGIMDWLHSISGTNLMITFAKQEKIAHLTIWS